MRILPPLPLAAPLLAAAILAGIGGRLPRRVVDIAATATALAVALLAAILLGKTAGGTSVYWVGAWQPHAGIALGISLAVDEFGAALALLVAVLVTGSFVYSWRYFEAAGELFHVLMLMFLGSMVGFCLSGDLFNLFVFFELMSVAAYALTGYKIEEHQALEGAINFAVSNSIGAYLMLLGIGLIYARTGALNLAQIGQTLAERPEDRLVILAMVLIFSGFFVKAAVVPFHFWLDDAHAVAPTPVCVLFSGVMVELGLYGAMRVYWAAFSGATGEHESAVRGVLVGMGVLTALVGAVMCFSQRHLKRMLAFSTISHTGLFLLGAAMLRPDALAGTGIYVLGHGCVKGALFMAAGLLLHRHSSVDESELRGRGKHMPWAGGLFLLGGLGLAGLPPFATFLGKSMIEEAAKHAGYGWFSGIAIIASALTGGAVLRNRPHFPRLGPPRIAQR